MDQFTAWLEGEQRKYPRSDYAAWCTYFAKAWQAHLNGETT